MSMNKSNDPFNYSKEGELEFLAHDYRFLADLGECKELLEDINKKKYKKAK